MKRAATGEAPALARSPDLDYLRRAGGFRADVVVVEVGGKWFCEIWALNLGEVRTVRRWPESIVWSAKDEGGFHVKTPAAGQSERITLLPNEGFVKRFPLNDAGKRLPPGNYEVRVQWDRGAGVPPLFAAFDVAPGE